MRIWRKADDFITYRCARCRTKGYASDGSTKATRPVLKRLRASTSTVADDAKRTADALAIWRASRSISGTQAATYLRSRGIRTDENLSHVLRFNPALYYDGGTVGGMVALMRDVVTDEPKAIHRTFLDGKARKIGRKMLGPAKGTSIKLDASEDVTSGLHLAEGIETALSARQVGYRPAWAMGSAGAIEAFPVLPWIEAISVFGENDARSRQAARVVSSRYKAAGLEMLFLEAESGDINDALRRVS